MTRCKSCILRQENSLPPGYLPIPSSVLDTTLPAFPQSPFLTFEYMMEAVTSCDDLPLFKSLHFSVTVFGLNIKHVLFSASRQPGSQCPREVEIQKVTLSDDASENRNQRTHFLLMYPSYLTLSLFSWGKKAFSVNR